MCFRIMLRHLFSIGVQLRFLEASFKSSSVMLRTCSSGGSSRFQPPFTSKPFTVRAAFAGIPQVSTQLPRLNSL